MASYVVSSFSDLQGQAASGQLPPSAVQTFQTFTDPSWISSLSGAKITGNISGNAASITGSITESQVTGLSIDLANRPTTGSAASFSSVTDSGLTSGSVIFAGSGGVLSQDNTNLNWDNTNKILRIGPAGTSLAQGQLQVVSLSDTSIPVVIQTNSSTQSGHLFEARDNASSPKFYLDPGFGIHLAGSGYVNFNNANGLLWPDTQQWRLYRLLSDSNVYLRDDTNGRMQATFTPGASNSAAITTLNSQLQIGGGSNIIQPLTSTATLNFGSIPANSTADLTMTLTGAAINDSVDVGPPATLNAGITAEGFVSAANTVTIRLANITTSPITVASSIFRASIIRF